MVSDTTPRLWQEDADTQLANLMTQEAGRFWAKNVLALVPPLPMTSERREWLCNRYPDITRGMRQATEDEAYKSRRLLMCSGRIKLLKAREAQLKDELIMALGDAEGMKGIGWTFTHREKAGSVSWKAAAEQLAAEVASAQGHPMKAQQILERIQEQHRGAGKRTPRHNPKRGSK